MSVQLPLISICIPAFKRIDFLQRLFQSISDQSLKDFEVIVSDDSPDESVEKLCLQYQNIFSLTYHRNPFPLGTPENWNEAIRKANGKWIKLMHDDDWFTNPGSLQSFANEALACEGNSFVFSAYRNMYSENPERDKDIFPDTLKYKMFLKNRFMLFSGNVIGPPSCVMYRQNKDVHFDIRLKWLVDIDFYISYLAVNKPVYIPSVLINIGISDVQVTKESFGNRKIEVPEYFLLLSKIGNAVLTNLWVFDSWWRLMRNLRIKKIEDIREAGYHGEVPEIIQSIIRFQNKLPSGVLRNGLASKMAMSICFFQSKI